VSACLTGGRTFQKECVNMCHMKSKSAANRMRKEYGEKCCDSCFGCCNRQWNNHEEKKMVCIAFDGDLAWNGAETACGLFNVPFRGIRPPRLPLGEFLERSSRARVPVIECENQNTLFAG